MPDRTTEALLKDADKYTEHHIISYSPDTAYNLISELSAKLQEREWQPIEGAKTDGTWYELLFEGDDDSPNHFDNGYQIYYGYHSLRAWRTKDHVTGNPKYYRAMILPTPHKKDKD